VRSSGFCMDIYCDGDLCNWMMTSQRLFQYGSFNGEHSETACVKAARKDGWQIGKRDLCPKCNNKRNHNE